MNMDFIRNHPEAANIPQDKLNFLLQFANKNFSGDAKQLAGELNAAANSAKQQGYTFNQQETELLISLLKQNMSAEEAAKADKIISLVKTFRPRK